MRPFCLLNGFLTTSGDVDLLHASPSESILQHEGSTARLELLHECLAVPGRTKYQVLFDQSAECDRSRKAGLLCRRADVLPMLDLLQEHDDLSSDSGSAADVIFRRDSKSMVI